MATGDAANEASNSVELTIEASAKRCLERFQKTLERIQASQIGPRELSMVEDQMAKFSSWATGMGVFAAVPESMDYYLPNDSYIRNSVCSLLDSLNYRITKTSSFLETVEKDEVKDSLSAQVDELKQSFIHIDNEISHLNKLSDTIWRACNDTQTQISNEFDTDLLPTTFQRHEGNRFPNASEIIQQRLVQRRQVSERRKHMDRHGTFWRCLSHRGMGTFSTREEYVKHIQEDHKINLSDTQLRTLAKRKCRKIAKVFAIHGNMESQSVTSDQGNTTEDARSGNISAGAPEAQVGSTRRSHID